MAAVTLPQLLSIFLLGGALCESFSSNATLRCTLETGVTCHQYAGLKRANLACNITDTFEVCDQLCNSGNCSMSCHAPACKQNCLAGRCRDMLCDSPSCYQRCVRGNCHMECRGKNCEQQCDTGGCDISCPAGSEICIQKSL